MAHQSPLLAIPRKTTADTDWAGPIRSTIAHSFGESPDAYAEEIAALQRCRQDAVRGAGSDTTARDLLYKYFGQLELLELRFAEMKVSFAWNDAFTGKLTTQTSLAFEKASIIHLLASVLSSLAASQSRADPEGLKRAYFNSRATAGMLTYINENFLHAPSTDLSRDVVHLLINLSLAQATEVFMEKLVEEKKAASLVARTANQVATMYAGLVDEMREFQGKGVFDRHWMTVLQIKAKLFASIAQYQRAKVDDAAGKHGAALVRFKMADSLAQEALRTANNFNYSFVASSSPTLPHDAGPTMAEIVKAHASLCAEAKTEAIRDNDLIYHEILPSEASLPAIDKLPPATAITIQEVYGNAEVSKLIGPDIFNRLIPLAVHESASVYSEEKAKLVRAEVERVELSEMEVRSGLDNLGLPGAVNRWRRIADGDDNDKEVDVSSSLIRISEEVSRSGSLDARIRSLEADHARFNSELTELTGLLDNESRECERARAKYAGSFTQSPSGPQTTHFRQNITSNLQSLQAATSADQQIIALWRDIQPDVEVLAAGPDALRGVARDVAAGKNKPAAPVPEGMSLLDLQDEETVKPPMDAAEQEEVRKAAKDVTDRLDRLNKIRRERDDVLKQLKEKIQNDDVSNLLLLNRRSGNVEPQLFATELEKFRPFQSRLAAAVQASKGIVAELEGIVGKVERLKGVRERQRGAKEGAKRVRDWEKKLEHAGASHAEVVEGLGKGSAFYESLDKVLVDLRTQVKAFVQSRDSERSRMISDIETRNRLASSSSPPAGPSPPVPSRSGLDSQLASLNLGSGTSSSTSAYPAPPAPPKPSSPSHNPYDFGSLSSLPSAFSSAPASTPPAPAPPRQSSYSSYPSFPSAPSAPPTTSPPPQSPYPPPPSSYPARTTSTGAPSQSSQAPYPPPPSQSPYSPPPSQSPYSPPQSTYSGPSSAYPPPPPPPQRPYGAPQPPAQYGSNQYGSNQYGYAPPPPAGYYQQPQQHQRTGQQQQYPPYAPPTGYQQQPPQQQHQQQPPQQQQYGGYPQQQYGGYQYR